MYIYNRQSAGDEQQRRATEIVNAQPASFSQHIRARQGLGEVAWRTRRSAPSGAPYLRFLNLDQFKWNESALTPQLKEQVGYLARLVASSWKSMQPIGLIRLTGHTDSTGSEKFNVDLGNRRAQAVEAELQQRLAPLLRRVLIEVKPSPGAAQPVADNRTTEGRARNRRVEVFIAPPEPPPPPPPKVPVIKVPIEDIERRLEEERRYNRPIPTLPGGKSFRQFVDGWLSDHHVPKWIRNKIWDAIFGKDFGAINSLLGAAGIGGPEKEAFLETVRALAEVTVR